MCLDLAEIAIHAAARGVEDEFNAASSGRLGNVVRERRALIEVDSGIGCRSGDVGVGCQVDHGVVSRHGLQQVLEIPDFADLDAQPWVVGDVREMPAASRGEVVVNGYLLGSLAQQVLHKMTANEACTAHDGEAAQCGGHFSDSQRVAILARAGCVTRRCQTTAQSPSVCGVMWSG